MRLALTIASAAALCAPAPAGAQQPLGIVDRTLARFDRDTLQPVGPVIPVAEAHSVPVVAPDGRRFALGLSSTADPTVPTSGRGRVGLWIVDAGALRIERQVQTGIAAEAVVFPGMVAAVLQDGALVVVDPDDGRILSRRQVGYSFSTPDGVHAGRHGVIVNEVRRGRGVEVVVVSPAGGVRTAFIRLPGIGRTVALVSDGDRAYIAGAGRVAVLDPATMRVKTRRVEGRATSAAIAGGALALAGSDGLRVYDTSSWRRLARDSGSRAVFASGRTIVATGGGRITAYDPRGRVRWRALGTAAGVAASRVYAQPAVLDVASGARVGTHPKLATVLRFTSS